MNTHERMALDRHIEREQEEETMTRITFGFLTGDLLNDMQGIDMAASIRELVATSKASVQRAFPDAEVEVRTQEGSGSLPWDLQIHVYRDDRDAEAESQDEGAVSAILAEVYESFDWVMDAG